jgi:4-hydroxy-tetrahydrodipicolinate synthase
MFKGVFTALITPFRYGEVDVEAYKKLIEWQIESGVDGLIVAGTTGEGQSLSQEEFIKLIEVAVDVANKRVKIIANTGMVSTLKTIELTKIAQEKDVDAVLVIAPYYIKPSQEGLFQHFKTIHDLTNIPIMLYNNPNRCSIDINNDTIVKLSNLERIKALKECSGDILRCSKLKQEISSDFSIMSGDDQMMLPLYTQGAVGVISVVANIVPALVVQLHNLWNESKINEAIEIQNMLMPLCEALLCETNPVGFKYAASQFEICLPDVRLPLVQLTEPNKKLIRESLQVLKAKLYESE